MYSLRAQQKPSLLVYLRCEILLDYLHLALVKYVRKNRRKSYEEVILFSVLLLTEIKEIYLISGLFNEEISEHFRMKDV
jgi:hypothetical protein